MKPSFVVGCFLLYGACLTSVVQGESFVDFVPSVLSNMSDAEMYGKYLDLDKQLQNLAEQGVKSVLPSMMEMSGKINISASCMRNSFNLIRGIRKLKMWALRFVDANPKLPEGFLRGPGGLLGDFDECLRITVPRRDGAVDFTGKYCAVFAKPILPKAKGVVNVDDGLKEFKLAMQNGSDLIRFVADFSYAFQLVEWRLGLCVPSGCSNEDIEAILNHFAPDLMIAAKVDSCQVEEEQSQLDIRAFFTIFVFCVFGAFSIFVAILDYYLKDKDEANRSMITKLVLCFSLTTNFRKLVNTKTHFPSLTCLHGIRVLTLFYIILAHQYFVMLMIPTLRNAIDMTDFYRRFFSQIILNGFLCVEVFMFMSGFLHSFLRTNREPDGSVSDKMPGYIKIMILRIVRLAPLYIICTLWFFIMVPRGPFTPELKRRLWRPCEDNWWWNVLFIHNFFNIEDMCMEQTWYISADTQVFLLSLLPIGYLISKGKVGVWLNSTLIVIGLVITIVWCWMLDSPPSTIIHTPNKENFLQYQLMYTMPFCHIAPYFTGVLLGFYLAKKKDIKIPKAYQVIGWPVAILLSTSMLFVTYTWNNGAPVSRLESALYFGFSKLVYVLGLSWLVLCCVTGHGGIINYILSLKVWIPISRLSYAVYLLSPNLQVFYRINSRYLDDMHEMHVIWRFLGDIFISCLLALPFVVVFESPIIALMKLLLPLDEWMNAKKGGEDDKPAEGVENGGFENGGIKNGDVSLYIIHKNEKNQVSHF